MGRLPFACAALAALASASFSVMTIAQPYPARPITVIVPFAAGGPVDTDTRRYAARLSEMIGQSVVVDYRPGAGTSIGAAYVAKAKPDGYTLLSNSSAHAVFPAFYKDLKFDPVKDLAPITMMNALVSVLMVPPSSPVKTFSDYLSYTRNNPGKLSYGTSGVGDVSHLSAVWMQSLAGTQVTFVPYKGNGPMMIDLLAGRVDVGSASLVQALPHIRAGKLRALAVRGANRVKPLPDVPAVAEHPEMKEFAHVNWLGFFAPAATPAPIIDKLASTLIAVTRLPEVIAELESQASTPVGNTSAEFKAIVTEEIARWRKIVTETGITP
jgi:tripartite-type tricarboxylate transporter receptor subunit TctC